MTEHVYYCPKRDTIEVCDDYAHGLGQLGKVVYRMWLNKGNYSIEWDYTVYLGEL